MSTFGSLAARPPPRGMLEMAEGAVFPAGRPPIRFTGGLFTSFWDAPLFSSRIPIRTGERERVTRGGFAFCDVLPGEVGSESALPR